MSGASSGSCAAGSSELERLIAWNNIARPGYDGTWCGMIMYPHPTVPRLPNGEYVMVPAGFIKHSCRSRRTLSNCFRSWRRIMQVILLKLPDAQQRFLSRPRVAWTRATETSDALCRTPDICCLPTSPPFCSMWPTHSCSATLRLSAIIRTTCT